MAIIGQEDKFGENGYTIWCGDTTPALETFPSWYTPRNCDEYHNTSTGNKYIYQTTWRLVTTS